MERLTERMNDELNGVWVKDHDYIAAVRRLAAYEDTGLEPEEILSGKELAEIACALNELTAYKATGLTPEAYKRYAEAIGKLDIAHMHELLQAEKDGRLYSHEMNDAGQVRLLETICRSKAKIIISGYRSELYDTYLAGWRSFDSQSQTTSGKVATETVWLNYEPPAEQMMILEE